MGRRSKVRGRKFEIDIARLIGKKWFGDKDCLWHTHGSGMMGHHVEKQVGDICPNQGYSIQNWHLCIEVKNREEWSFDHVFKNPNTNTAPLYLYWKQVLADSQRFVTMTPLLIVRKNYYPVYLLYNKSLHKIYPALKNLKIYGLLNMDNRFIVITLLDELLNKTKPKDFGMKLIV